MRCLRTPFPWLAVLVAGPLTGCPAEPPLQPFVVRVEAVGSYLARPTGELWASEDASEHLLEGDQLDLHHDLDLGDTSAYGARLDVNLHDHGEVRATYQFAEEFEGHRTLTRERRFDGQTYHVGENVESELGWQRIAVSYAQRLFASRGQGFLDTDVLVRAGFERDQFDTELTGNINPRESRQIIVAGPFAGIEARALAAHDVLLWSSLDAGGWIHDGAHLTIFDIATGVRVGVLGPLEASLSYEFAVRNAYTHDEEISGTRLVVHVIALGVGLRF